MRYFAYGSNMDWDQMKERCPSARFTGVAVLRDHRLAFTRRSVRRDCGVADVVRDKGRTVWGAVFEIDDVDVGCLDTAEGYHQGREGNSYVRKESQVFVGGDNRKPLTVAVYFGEPQDAPPLPNQKYKDLILAGARRWRVPDDYIKELEAIEISAE